MSTPTIIKAAEDSWDEAMELISQEFADIKKEFKELANAMIGYSAACMELAKLMKIRKTIGVLGHMSGMRYRFPKSLNRLKQQHGKH